MSRPGTVETRAPSEFQLLALVSGIVRRDGGRTVIPKADMEAPCESVEVSVDDKGDTVVQRPWGQDRG